MQSLDVPASDLVDERMAKGLTVIESGRSIQEARAIRFFGANNSKKLLDVPTKTATEMPGGC